MDLEKKVDYLTFLIEEMSENSIKFRPPFSIADLLLGGVLGYFLFQVMDHHFRA